jgi:DHA1 family bicyclomycin/chloramphenicol resistance-like MFS transporter
VVSNALFGGVLSPLLSDSGLHLALGAAAFSLLGWLCWRWERVRMRRVPPAPAEPVAPTPMEQA